MTVYTKAEDLSSLPSQLSGHFVRGDASPVIPGPLREGLAALNERIEGVYSAAHADRHYDIDDLLAELETYVDLLMSGLERAHEESLVLLDRFSASASHTIAWPALAFYCPFCNTSPADGNKELATATSLVKDVTAGAWRCPVCDQLVLEGTEILLGRFRDELFYPLYDQILLSHREALMEIDREVEDELLRLDKERRIKIQECKLNVQQEHGKRLAKLRELRSRAGALRAQVLGMTAALGRYEKLSRSVRDQFENDCREIARQVEQRSQQAIERIEREFARRQALADQESDRRMRINREEEQRRHREVIEAQERLAKIQMMTPEEKQAMRKESILDPINPFKQMRQWRANRNAAAAAANVT